MNPLIKSIWSSIVEFFEKFFVVITIVFGLLFLIISFSVDSNSLPEKISKLLYTIGSISLTSGVFAGIVKSKQFKDIYKKILREIIYCTEHFEKRNDLENIWEITTKTLVNRKFEKISNLMNENIKKYFLPLEHDYYYDGFSVEIHIERDPDHQNFLIFNEVTKYTIICDDDNLIISNKYLNQIKFNPSSPKKSSYELKNLYVNGVKQTGIEVVYDTTGNKLTSKYEKPLTGNFKYEVKREDVKIYELDYNNLRKQLAVWIYHNCYVDITYPKDLKITFHDLGVLGKFQVDKKHNTYYNRIQAEYKGLIYKNQGFFFEIENI